MSRDNRPIRVQVYLGRGGISTMEKVGIGMLVGLPALGILIVYGPNFFPGLGRLIGNLWGYHAG